MRTPSIATLYQNWNSSLLKFINLLLFYNIFRGKKVVFHRMSISFKGQSIGSKNKSVGFIAKILTI